MKGAAKVMVPHTGAAVIVTENNGNWAGLLNGIKPKGESC